MSYHSITIKNIIKDIEGSKAYLPAIQRKFVWPRWKIEHLFDSIMRNYPIGSFLFWELNSQKANEYVFYEFLRNYDERTPNNVRKTGTFLVPEIIGVLDGQQRLSSIYLGLQGFHRERLKYHRTTSDHAYPKTQLYLNLLSLPFSNTEDGKLDIEREKDFEFRFLKTVDAQNSQYRNEEGKFEPCLWYKVGEVLAWNEDPEIDEFYDKLKENSEDEEQKERIIADKRKIKKALRTLHQRICNDQIINYFKVTKDDLDDILKIFIRVNSGGTQLSKTDLLFSTIVATWEDGRDEIEAFLKEINSKGDGFWFNNDFLMRSCLVLSDLPVLFKVNSFRSENVDLIKRNWKKIKESLSRTVDFLTTLGFSGSVLTSQNAIIVIAYHIMKGGDFSHTSKEGLRKYLLFALLKNIYGGQGDQVISNFRNAMRSKNADNSYSLKNLQFPIEDLLKLQLPANKSLAITTEDVEEFMNYRKGPNSFFVLSLLYPHLRYNEVHFHQDHIHPDSKFTDAKMKAAGIPEENWEDWKQIKDTVPNLQLMEGRQNTSKNASTFEDWVYGKNSSGKQNVADIQKFCNDNYIPNDVSFSFSSFEPFYQRRKEIIMEELNSVLGIESKEAAMNH